MTTQFDIKLALSVSAFAIICLISGCVGGSQSKPGQPENTVACKGPRHSMCTMEYRPVCGHLKDGSVKTFSNPCTACSNENVEGFTHGPCSE
jgi:hypothetical protein